MADTGEKVTVVCLNDSLAEKIRQADTGHAVKEVVTSAKRPVYEHAPALYVHGPHWFDLTPAVPDNPTPPEMPIPPAMNTRSPVSYADDQAEPPPKPDPFGGFLFHRPPQAENLSEAIKKGEILGLAFAEPISKPGTPSEEAPEYMADFFVGLLPSALLSEQRFRFARQDPPDAQPKSASEQIVPWIDPLLDCFAERIHVRIESPRLRPVMPVALPKPGETPRRAASRRILNDIYGWARNERWKAGVEPLVVNRIGKPLGVAVVVEHGAVIILPECRDAAAKAKAIRMLASDLWTPVQEWIRENAARRKAAAEYQEPEPTPVPVQGESRNETDATKDGGEVKSAEATIETDWRDVQRRLLALCDRGEPYTNTRELADRLRCSTSTISKAINDSRILKEWYRITGNSRSAPRAQSLSEVVLDNTPRPSATDLADALDEETDVEREFHRLIQETDPDVRDRLNAIPREELLKMTPDQLRGIVEVLNDDPDEGDRVLDRGP